MTGAGFSPQHLCSSLGFGTDAFGNGIGGGLKNTHP